MKGIFVNIFGGIMKCDVIAEGVIAAAKELGLKVPLVVRLEGTNVEPGAEILERDRASTITAADDMADGAQKIVDARQEGRLSHGILVDKNTKLLVQGITGGQGAFHAQQVHRVRHEGRRRRHARQGRREVRGQGPDLRHRRARP